jgi:UDP-N-acetyl-D-glucosamine dehydrogenase
MSSIKADLLEKLHARTAKIAVLGLGYVGLPFATVFAEAGFEVIGIDPDSKKINALGDPDLSFILSVAGDLSKYMHAGMVVVLESTTYPGTTREIERVDPGREDWTTINTPKVIGGITESCTEVATAWYDRALETVVPVTSSEVAEMTKLLENTFRMINIGLVNELAIMCDRLGIDVWEVVDAAATKPFGFMKFTPGPGLGGHCIPIDPLYLSWKLKSLNYTARFIELASEINLGMPRYVLRKVQDTLNENGKPLKGSKVLVLGVSYKPNIDDLRESPALDVVGLLAQMGTDVSYHDPYVPEINEDEISLICVPDLMADVKLADCVVIITNHSDYDYAAILEAAQCIVDTRNALGELGRNHPKVTRL